MKMLILKMIYFLFKVELNRNIWTYNQLLSRESPEASGTIDSGLGICCLDLEPPHPLS